MQAGRGQCWNHGPATHHITSPPRRSQAASRDLNGIIFFKSSAATVACLILSAGLVCSASAFSVPHYGISHGATREDRMCRLGSLNRSCGGARIFASAGNAGGMLPLQVVPRRSLRKRMILRTSSRPSKSSTSTAPAQPLLRSHKQTMFRIISLLFCGLLGMAFSAVRGVSAHMAMSGGSAVGKGTLPPLWRVGLWLFLFIAAACLAGAETAITTMWPWKVKKIAEEEGADSPFRLLEKDITKFLTAILICTTSATIYSAALVTDMAAQYGGEKMVTAATLWLTGLTLVVGEIIPKALAVSQAERVSRVMVPIINFLALLVYPVGKLMELTSKTMLHLMGIKQSDDSNVSEEELRMIVMGAKISGEIKTEEQEMIDSVLDLQDTMVSDIMRPRVEVVALEASTDIATFVGAVTSTGYSRFPIFEDNIDNIIGMVLAKNLIDYLDSPTSLDSVTVADIMDPAYYVPQSMAVWNVLEEMRRRRIHMAIVVDEYGGTAGIVTLEDILEEVIGEIYDEDDIDELVKEESSIFKEADGSYTIDGFAVLEEAVKALDIQIDPSDQQKFGTVSGFLCHKAGRIPPIGARIIVHKGPPESDAWCFTVTEADERRIISVKAEPARHSLPVLTPVAADAGGANLSPTENEI